MRNKKARKNEQLFIYFVAFLHSINKNQVAFISALEEPRIPARFPKNSEGESAERPENISHKPSAVKMIRRILVTMSKYLFIETFFSDFCIIIFLLFCLSSVSPIFLEKSSLDFSNYFTIAIIK